MFDSSSKRMREFDHAALCCCGALNPFCGHYLRRYCLTREPVTGLPKSARGRWSLGVRHPEQVAAEADAPCEDGIDDHPLHPAVPETEEVIRNEQAEGGERTDPEQDRHIGERRAKDPEREDGGQTREEERDERDDGVEEAKGLREDADPDGTDSGEEDRDHEESILECAEDEPRRCEDDDAEQDDRSVEDRRRG